MNITFSQTADLCTSSPMEQDFSDRILHGIRNHTNLNYTCTKIEDGYFLEPIFRKMSHINSFVPEIFISVSQTSDETRLHLEGQPVRSVRSFIRICLFMCLFLVLSSLGDIIAANRNGVIFVIVPLIIGTFTYFLCKLATKATFKKVFFAIQKEFP